MFLNKISFGKNLFFILSCFFGAALLFPYLDFLPYLSQGDHGINLYAARAVLKGQRPFHDFLWFYGPLMPYYYALFLKLFGISVQSILLGYCLLKWVSGIFIFLTLSTVISPLAAFIGAIWFWIFSNDFFYTFNHAGGITLLSIITFLTVSYINSQRRHALWLNLLFIFILGFIKLNYSFSVLAGVIVIVFITDLLFKNRIYKSNTFFFCMAIFFLPVVIIGSNWLCVYGMPFESIRQCYQYFGNFSTVGNYHDIFTNFRSLVYKNYIMFTKSNLTNLFFGFMTITASVSGIIKLIKNPFNDTHRRYLLAFLTFGLFYVLQLHEFLISGIIFRMYWADIYKTLMFFLILDFALKNTHKTIKAFLFITILCTSLIHYNADIGNIYDHFKNKSQFISLPRVRIFVRNSPFWISTTSETVHFLNANLKEDELFFALPYEPLYYFLTGKISPDRQLALFEFMIITDAQQESLIRNLESKNVNWIILSNRAISSEAGMGIFNQTYCKILGKYILENFKVVKDIGTWTPNPGWIEPHSIRIFKRKFPNQKR